MSAWSRAATVALLCALLAVVSTAGLAAPGVDTDSQQPSVATAERPASTSVPSTVRVDDGRNTTIAIRLQDDGDARWAITTRFNLSTETEREAFRRLATDFEDGEAAGAQLGLGAFERAVELVDAATDREMAIRDVERTTSSEAEIQNGQGAVTLTFTWENFARFEGESLRIDDVLETERGLWFEGLTDSQELIVRSPEGFGVVNASVPARNGELRWEGPMDFDNTTLRATFVGDGGGPPADPTPTPTPVDGGDESMGFALGVVAIVALAIVVAVAVSRRDRIEAVIFPEETPESDSPETAREPEAETEPSREDETGSESAAADEQKQDQIDVGLLSDEERVERLLRQNGGRMKQANIVKETDWSNAKVSQLLSSMEEDGRIDKLRIGRENLISFPDEDVADITDEE